MEAGKGIPTSKGMLANCFNNLLNKSTAKTPGATKADKASVSREAAAQLERLQKSKKITSEAKLNGPDSAAS